MKKAQKITSRRTSAKGDVQRPKSSFPPSAGTSSPFGGPPATDQLQNPFIGGQSPPPPEGMSAKIARQRPKKGAP